MTEPDPDQLLKSLDAELSRAKAKRSRAGVGRNMLRILSLVILLAGIIALLALLQYVMSQLREHPPASKSNAPVTGTK